MFRADAVRSALDVLVVCSVMAKFQATLCDTLIIDEGHSTAGMRLTLSHIIVFEFVLITFSFSM